MTRISWNDVGQRFYEAGTDRGVLYLDGQSGVPWNGLVGVSENVNGGEARPFYLDGFKYLNMSAAEEYSATISAFSSPRAFDACDGSAAIHNGLFATQQPRKPFGFTYRTLVGNDVDGLSLGYKIHLVYNALAEPSQKAYNTNTDTPEAMTFEWGITTMSPVVTGIKPTAHFVIDSRLTPPKLLEYIENVLYGTSNSNPRLPTANDLANLFRDLPPIAATNWAVNGSFEGASANVTYRRNLIRFLTSDNTTGWSPVGSPTLVVDDGKLKVVATASTTIRMGVNTNMVAPKPAGNYTVSFRGKAINSSITQVRVILHDSVTQTNRGSMTLPLVGGGISDTKYEFSFTTTGEFNMIYLEFLPDTNGSINNGAIGYISEPIAETGTLHRPFFNGLQVPKVRRNAATQPQPTADSGFLSNDETLYSRTFDSTGGRRTDSGAAVFTRQLANPSNILANSRGIGMPEWVSNNVWIPVTPGETWTVSDYVTADVEFNTTLIITFRDYQGFGFGSSVSSVVTPDSAPNKWVRPTITFTVPPNAAFFGVQQVVNRKAGVLTQGGEKTKITDALFEVGPLVGAFFDASFTAPRGYKYAWEGVVGKSPSYLYDTDLTLNWTDTVGSSEADLIGVGVASYSSPQGNVRAIQSMRWSDSGSRSVRMIPAQPTTRGLSYLDLATSATPKGLVPGNTYTLIGSFYQQVAQNFDFDDGLRYRAMSLIGVTLDGYAKSVQAEDIPGRQVLRMVFKVPPIGDWYLRLYNGGMLGDESVWWDSVAIVDGDYDGFAFNGDTPNTSKNIYTWAGAQYQSVSYLRTWY